MLIEYPIKLYGSIIQTFQDIYSKNKKKNNVLINKRTDCSWINKETRDMILHRGKLFKKWKNEPNNNILRLEYNRSRNKTQKFINKFKDISRKQELIEAGKDSRKIWKITNRLGKESSSLDEVI